jgi:hypothetical protein
MLRTRIQAHSSCDEKNGGGPRVDRPLFRRPPPSLPTFSTVTSVLAIYSGDLVVLLRRSPPFRLVMLVLLAGWVTSNRS